MLYIIVIVALLVLFAALPRFTVGSILTAIGGFGGFWIGIIAEAFFEMSGPNHEHGAAVVIVSTLVCAIALPVAAWLANKRS